MAVRRRLVKSPSQGTRQRGARCGTKGVPARAAILLNTNL